MPFYPPLEVELTEDSGSSLVEISSSSPEQNEGDNLSETSNSLSITVAASGVDQIPSTITSLSPRSDTSHWVGGV